MADIDSKQHDTMKDIFKKRIRDDIFGACLAHETCGNMKQFVLVTDKKTIKVLDYAMTNPELVQMGAAST